MLFLKKENDKMANVPMIAHLRQFDAWYLGTHHIRAQQWLRRVRLTHQSLNAGIHDQNLDL